MNDFLSEADAFEQASKTPSTDDFLPDYSESATALSDPYYEFKLDRYQVSEDDFRKYGIIPLSRGYFTVVSPDDYDKASRLSWAANVQRDRITGRILKIYAQRKTRQRERAKGAPNYVYLHRYLTGTVLAGRKVIIDHRNGQSLDTRRCNLAGTNHGHNMANKSDANATPRTKNPDLPRGVEPVIRKGKQRYWPAVHVSGKKIRAKQTFSCPERAGRWFRRMNSKLRPEACLANPSSDLPPPIKFPPLVEVLTDVPF